MTIERRIRVLIVDDSALVRQLLTSMLKTDPALEVVGTAADPYDAREKIKLLNPDVLTLDVEMPKMDGITFLSNLMRLRPMPVVMVSTLTEAGAETTLKALELGAVDFVPKPKEDLVHNFQNYADDIIGKIKTAAHARLAPPFVVREKLSAESVLAPIQAPRHFGTTRKIIAIGSSTGGTEALKEVLSRMPASAPAIVISQHIPAAFSGPLAKRLDTLSKMAVKEAADGDLLEPGHAYLAPGGRHLIVMRDGLRYRCQLSDGPAVNRHRPSVDVMFRSVAKCAGPIAVGVILTGMGDDGARGMKEMREAGAATIAQDEATSVVWGMPGEAVKLGAAAEVIPLDRVAGRLMELISGATERRRKPT